MCKRKYEDVQKEAVYENSIDCLIYGYGFAYLNTCGMTENEALKIWNIAKNDLANR